MSGKSKEAQTNKVFYSVQRYLSFFFLMAFMITCCMILFLRSMASTMQLTFTEDGIRQAAILTFINVVGLSLVCTVVDGIRRRVMVERPIQNITTAAEKVMKGDFTARVEQPHGGLNNFTDFNEVIAYFNKMVEELSGLETLRTDFISNVSHELKTPLAVVQNYGTLLQQPDLPEEKRLEYAKAITDACRRLANMITNILKLNKLENQQIFPAGQPYDLGEQLCECLLGFEEIWEQKNLDIETDMEDGVFVEMDAELLTLVWNNLFSNATKFTKPHGKISLRLKTEGNFAVVQVSDTGCGISPEVGQHIFDKFYQGDTSHATSGNGLGLALVKRIVDIVGGDISVQSEVGKGSTFTVKLERKNDGTS